MTVIEHERIDAGKDNAPRIFHIWRNGAKKALCGKPVGRPTEAYRCDGPMPPHQMCVVCADLRGLS